ncbi:MAG: DUF4164 family protein [Pseudomonadota bacterium]
MDSLANAQNHLTSALDRLEQALDSLFDQAGDPVTAARELALMQADRLRLANDLDAALGREAELQGLADEASEALGTAIEEVRAALTKEE